VSSRNLLSSRASKSGRASERVRGEERSASTLKKEGQEATATSRASSLFLLFLPLLPSKTASATKSWSYSPRNRRDEKLTSRRHLIIYLGQRDRGRNWPDFPSMRSRWSPRDGTNEETWLYRLLHTGAAAGPIRGSAIRMRFHSSLQLWYSSTLLSTVSILTSKIWSLDATSSPSPTLEDSRACSHNS